MHDKKSVYIIWIYDYILKNKAVTSKIIYDNLDINDRQLWRYIADIKEYFNTYTEYELSYSKREKQYSLNKR